MKKRGIALILAVVMTFGLTMPVFAADSDDSGSASGVTTLSGEIAYTTAYTLTIPASISDMDLSQAAETTLGAVSVAKQNDDAEFDPAKKVAVSVEYTGELVNTEDSNKKVIYKLQQSKGEEEATDVVTGDRLSFSAEEIESGDVQYNLKAVITETIKSGGTYSGTVNFSAAVENKTVSFQVACSESEEIIWTTYEVEAGTTWGEFAKIYGIEYDCSIDDDGIHIICGDCKEYWVKENATNVEVTDVIKENGRYHC